MFEESKSSILKKTAAQKRWLPGYTSFFTWLEIESAVCRRLVEGSITIQMLSEVRMQLSILKAMFVNIWPDENIMKESIQYVHELGLKPADSLHLSSAAFLNELQMKHENNSIGFVCYDKSLNHAAITIGFKTTAI
jgi:hypothetical protein